MSHFRLHTNRKERGYGKYLIYGLVCLVAAGAVGYGIHGIGQARARSRETVLIYTEEEFSQYLVERESGEYNLNGRYQLEEDLDLSGLEESVGSNLEPFTGRLDGNGHVITGLSRPLFGVMKSAEATNLFFSDVMITNPVTYHDGERYVDGYGALAAYAVDSVIENCGMNGEIVTASPSEAEYQLEKASPPDADERRGPGSVGPGEEAAQVESSPVMESVGAGGPAGGAGDGLIDGPAGDTESGNAGGTKGPGAETSEKAGNEETEGADSTKSAENADSTESAENTESAESTKSAENVESTESTESTKSTENIESTESADSTKSAESTENAESTKSAENVESTENAESTKSAENAESTENIEGTENAKGTETIKSTGSGEESVTKTKEGDSSVSLESYANESGSTEILSMAGSQERGTKADTDTAKASDETGVPSKEEGSYAETVGFRNHDRQYLMMKIPEIAATDMEEILNASPSNATPPEAAMEPEADGPGVETKEEMSGAGGLPPEETKEIEYIGNPNGDIYILVTADRITAGGLIAQTAGETLITGSFALETIGSAQNEIETFTGGLIGILGAGTRAENSYAAGLADSTGTTGGFAAVNEGTIENSYTAVTIGSSGTRRGAFTATGNGRLNGCVYDRQMACVSEADILKEGTEWNSLSEADESLEENTPSEAEEFHLKGMRTEELTGPDSQMPGNWRKTENAYPQLENFALHAHEAVSASSRASAIALILPGELTLADVLQNGDVVLPSEIDEAAVVWEAEGNIRIDEKNQVVSDEMANITPHDPVMLKAALTGHKESGAESESESESEFESEFESEPESESEFESEPESEFESESEPETSQEAAAAESKESRLTAQINGAARTFQLNVSASPRAASATWDSVVVAKSWDETYLRKHTVYVNGRSIPMLEGGDGSSEANAYKINSAEAFAWFSYQMNNSYDTFKEKCVVLGADIDLSGIEYGGSASAPLLFSPMGSLTNSFNGVMDGGGHTLDYLNIDYQGTESNIGLFRTLGDATIKDLIIGQYSQIKSNGRMVGAFFGGGYGTIDHCTNYADVTASEHAGGIGGEVAKYNKGTITRCSNWGTITSGRISGGIISYIRGQYVTVSQCYNAGTIIGNVAGDSRVSGICPANDGDVIKEGFSMAVSNCYNAGVLRSADGSISLYPIVRYGNCRNSYNDSTVMPESSLAGTNGVKFLTTKQMKSWGMAYALNGQSMTGVWKYTEGQYPDFGTLKRAESWGDIAEGMEAGLITVDSAVQDTTTGFYDITTPEQLAQFSCLVNGGSTGVKASLSADIDLTGTNYGGTSSNPLQWIPIAEGNRSYTGTFRGNGHTISELYILGSEKLGFFGSLGSGASISQVIINSGRILSDTSGGSVQYAGGIAGYMGGNGAAITGCELAGRLELPTAGKYFGGIIGGMRGGDNLITECSNGVTVTAEGDYVGGIAGYLEGSGNAITKCQNPGFVIGNGNYRGGIAGGSGGSNVVIDGCSSGPANAVVLSDSGSGFQGMGGILGGAVLGDIIVRNCYNQGNVAGNMSVGGIAGSVIPSASITGCYNTGLLSGRSVRSIAGTNTGRGNITYCFYTDTSVSDESGRRVTAEAMKSWGAAYALNGEKLSQTTGISWTYQTGNDFPTFGTLSAAESWETVGEVVANGFLDSPPTGSPLQIVTAEQLAWFAREINAGRLPAGTGATLHGNIDLAGSQCVPSGKLKWVPIGKDSAHAYTGEFRSAPSGGGTYRIRNMYVNTAGEAGLFGVVDSGGNISGIGMENVSVNGQTAGGIAGVLKGSAGISRCYSRAAGGSSSINGVSHAGGIAGQMAGSAEIKDCYNLGTQIRGTGASSYAGGIAGDGSAGTITSCYNANLTTGSITAGSSDGGSMTGTGGSGATVKSCYSDKQLPADRAYVGALDCSTDQKLQKQTDLLNTLDGVENKGAARSWFTSLAEEGTKGLPTLEPPVMVDVTVDPAGVSESGGSLTGSAGVWTGAALPGNLLYRGVHQENGSSSQPGFVPAAKSEVAGNYHKYGTENGHQNLALELGGKDVSSLTASLTNPADTISSTGSLNFYAGASYIYPGERTLVVDLAGKTAGAEGTEVTRYEVRVKVKGVERKTLSVSLPVKTYVELKPGVDTKAYTVSLSIVNRESGPVRFGITGVTAKETTEAGIDRKLEPVAGSVVIDDTKTLAKVKLGIEGNFSEGGSGALKKQVYYYTPPQEGTAASWLECEIGYGQKLDYQYFIEHSMLHVGPEQHFGFNIVYQFGIPADDVGNVVRGPAA